MVPYAVGEGGGRGGGGGNLGNDGSGDVCTGAAVAGAAEVVCRERGADSAEFHDGVFRREESVREFKAARDHAPGDPLMEHDYQWAAEELARMRGAATTKEL